MVSGRKCQNRLNIHNLSSNEEREENLTNIPLVEIWTDEEFKYIYTFHETLDVKIHSIEIDGVIKNNPKQINISYRPRQFGDLLNNEWLKKDGYTYNMDWIRLIQRLLAERLYYTDNFILKALAQNPKIMNAWFWFLVFKGVEFDKYDSIVKYLLSS